MSKWTTPSRYDYVGNFLRPETLEQARADQNTGRISREELHKMKNTYIADLIEKQKVLGYHIITDGESRRGYQYFDFMWRLNGIEEIELDHGYYFKGEEITHGSCCMTGKISDKNHPIVQDYFFMKQFGDENTIVKQTLPAPVQTLAELSRKDNARTTHESYPDEEELLRDLAAAYHRVYLDLYMAGCRNIQLNNCTWGMIVDEEGCWEIHESDDATFEQEAECCLKINSLSLEDLLEGLVVSAHICRGNYHLVYASSGPHDKVAPYVFVQENVHTFYLEFDDKRSSSFVSLKEIPRGERVVLGFIASKRPEFELKELIKRRIYEATQYVPFRDLCLSPQCGSAPYGVGSKLTEEGQPAKLRLIKEIAEEVWGEEEAQAGGKQCTERSVEIRVANSC